MMLSLADPTKYYQLLLSQGIGVGIASGALLVPALSIQSHHWRRKRSLVMGIVLCGIVHALTLNSCDAQLFTRRIFRRRNYLSDYAEPTLP